MIILEEGTILFNQRCAVCGDLIHIAITRKYGAIICNHCFDNTRKCFALGTISQYSECNKDPDPAWENIVRVIEETR